MEQRKAVRINLATPFRGSRMAGTVMPTRGEELARRFIGGFVSGAALTAAIVLVAAGFGALAPTSTSPEAWSAVVRHEVARVEGPMREPLQRAAELSAELRELERLHGSNSILARLLDAGQPTESEQRAAILLSRDVRHRLAQELEVVEKRMGELVAASEADRESAVRVLSLLRWQLGEGELARSLQQYEEGVAAAAAATAATAAARPEPTPTPTAVARRRR